MILRSLKKGKIIITIDEGEQYFLGKLEIEGASIYTDLELLNLLRLKKKKRSHLFSSSR